MRHGCSFWVRLEQLIHSVTPLLETEDHVPVLDNFEQTRIATSGAEIAVRKAGQGPPLLLLHGYPQTQVMWHKVAPALAERFTVVLTDLRGYGDSAKPPGGENHEGYSKRAMARDQVEVMAELGFDEFAVVGHDRGARVAHRMALDDPALRPARAPDRRRSGLLPRQEDRQMEPDRGLLR
jgi:pimeloyl-ACP methyl ester carboxylesterase